MRLTAKKTSLYRLAKEYVPEIPPMRQTNFRQYRQRSFWLDFSVGWNQYHLFFTACTGDALLTIECGSYRQVERISIEKLRQYGLVKEDKPQDGKEKAASLLDQGKRQ
ncbi:MAG TPA: hypothetical protein DC001_04960 [Clostridiales bacterium]|jgi:hypothetical protein|nr:hypothetical protein [Clostridiales bacterium]